MSLTTTLAWWGISSWVPPYIASVAGKAGQNGAQWASYAGMAYNFGAIIGYASLGFLADRFGRKPVVMIFFAMAFCHDAGPVPVDAGSHAAAWSPAR